MNNRIAHDGLSVKKDCRRVIGREIDTARENLVAFALPSADKNNLAFHTSRWEGIVVKASHWHIYGTARKGPKSGMTR